ncbi:MAG: glycosyltransferase [Bacteroidota bacterium]
MKLFILLSRVPFPLEKGDKLRAFNHIRCLSKYHEVHLFCLSDTEIHPQAVEVLEKYCMTITIARISKLRIYFGLLRTIFTRLPFQVGFFYNSIIKRKILAKIAEVKPDHVFCQLIRVTEYVKDLKIPKTLDFQDVFSKGAERMSSDSSLLMNFILKIEAKRVKKYEYTVFDYFNNKIIISAPDRDAIDHPDNQSIHVIPNGVDTDFFKPNIAIKHYDILFTGNMAYPPNINGVEFLVYQILPRLLKFRPEIKILIAGASPDKRVLRLASKNVTVSGWVEDIRTSYSDSKIFVAPMQIGTGLQNKLLEAMAMKLPCVTSGLANNALMSVEEVEILVGYSPDDYAKKIILLLDDKETYNRISEAGYNLVINKYNWETQVKKIHELIIKSG